MWLGVSPRMDTKKTCVEKRLDCAFQNMITIADPIADMNGRTNITIQ